ncbi:MAG: hypothetical protein NTX01_07295 [Candidatus Omnitrophica bacterium]|nr:hypothetical protein [Candidatus Omnitrophota bacterium]
MDIRINKEKGCIEAIFYYRDYHHKLGFLLSIFLLIFGLPFLIDGIRHHAFGTTSFFLMLLSPFFLGLLWAIIGKQKLFISQDKIEMSELIGNFVYRKKTFSTSEIESMHLHCGVVHDCREETEEVVFEGLVFTIRGGKQLKPFNYLNKADSRYLQEEIKSFLNLTISVNCSCANLKIPHSDSRCRNGV